MLGAYLAVYSLDSLSILTPAIKRTILPRFRVAMAYPEATLSGTE